MKKFILLLLIITVTRVSAQTNDYLVSMNGIGPFKVGMTKVQLEKLLGKKITLKNVFDTTANLMDTVKAKYKNMDVEITLDKKYLDDHKYDVVVMGVRSNSAVCKTKSGIAQGTGILKIVSDYEGAYISIWPQYEDEDNTIRSKTKSRVNVVIDDGNENTINFYLTNKKVWGFEVKFWSASD